MDPFQYCNIKTYVETKKEILQSLQEIITQEEWKQEKSTKRKLNTKRGKDSLQCVQLKLKEQLSEKKWTTEKKLNVAKITLTKAKKRRLEAGLKLHATEKKRDIHSQILNKVLRQHQLIKDSHEKV